MPRTRVLGRLLATSLLFALSVLGGACGPSPSGSCSSCGDVFDNVTCDQIAKAAGCEKGEVMTVTSCGDPAPFGCQFYGCKTVVPACVLPT